MGKDKFYVDLGAQLKTMRKKKKVSRDVIANHFDVGKDYVGKVERGERPLSAKRLIEWVTFLQGELQIGGEITVPNTLTIQQKTPEG